jgi:hypothetical protein
MIMQRGFDFLTFVPNTVPEINCKICACKMNVDRHSKGHSNFAAALAENISNHDVFWCANYKANWHVQCRELMLEMTRTASSSIRKMLKEEMEGIIKTKTSTLPEYQK